MSIIQTSLKLMLLISIVLLIFIGTSLIFIEIDVEGQTLNSKCTSQCLQFNWQMYKLEQVNSFSRINFYCWCLKNGEPYNIGTVN